MIKSPQNPRRPRTFAHYAGQFVILNLTLWSWSLFGTGHGIPLQIAICVCGSLAMFAWEYQANKRHQRQSRRAHGLCTSCGYDLQESRLRCPECGAAVSLEHRTRNALASDLDQVR